MRGTPKVRLADFIAHTSHEVKDVPEALALMSKWHPEFLPLRVENHSKSTAWRGAYAIICASELPGVRIALVTGAPKYDAPAGDPCSTFAYHTWRKQNGRRRN